MTHGHRPDWIAPDAGRGAIQLTPDWDKRFREGDTPWEDEVVAPSTKQLVREHVPAGSSILEVGCGLGTNSMWMAENGYRVVASDISATAVQQAAARTQAHVADIEFHVADVLGDCSALPRCDAIFERGVLHTFITDEGRARFAASIANLLEPGQLWLSISGNAATRAEAEEAVRKRHARACLSQIADAVEAHFDVVSIIRTIYGISHPKTDFPALACVFRKRG